MSGGFIRESPRIHLGRDVFEAFGALWVPMIESASTLLIFWLILWWIRVGGPSIGSDRRGLFPLWIRWILPLVGAIGSA